MNHWRVGRIGTRSARSSSSCRTPSLPVTASSSRRTGSPCSTTTAPCGLNNRCRCNWTSSSGRWRRPRTTTPRLAQQEPYKAILAMDRTFFEAVGEQQPDAIRSLEEALARTWLGKTPEEFEAEVATYLREVKSQRFGVAYPELVYKPMLELFDFLAANEFRVFVCSGGGRDFMRVIAESAWNIPREHVIGTAPSYRYEDGVIRRGDQVLGGLALGAGKPEHIFAYAGRLPAFAGGNADVDIEMLECAKFAMLVVHDDADREFAYTSAAEKSVAAGVKNGWTMVSVKDDWKVVFP